MTSSLPAPAQALPSPEGREGWAVVTVGLAGLGILLVGLDLDLYLGLTAGTMLVGAFLPLWLGSIRSSRWTVAVFSLIVASLAGDAALSAWMSGTREFSRVAFLESAFLLVTLAFGIGWILWARKLLPDWGIGVLFGAGLLLSVNPGSELFPVSPWKFGFALPITVIVLAFAMRARSRWVEVIALLALAGVSALSSARSGAATLVLVLVLVVWQSMKRPRTSRGAALRTVLFAGMLAVGTYFALQAAILDGAMGDEARERTLLQLDTSGTLIAGGRPELGATAALMGAQPAGFGGGTMPSMHDLQAAKSGMAGLGYDPNNGYVENYLFGAGIELHSVFGDLWAWYGLAGLALAVVLAVFFVSRVAMLTTSRSASALVLFLGIKAMWDLLFSPAETSLTTLVLGVGLLAPLVARAPGPPASSPV
ncbi:hypothetical protein GCM10027063_50050 [Promicromonospora xylanilytica]